GFLRQRRGYGNRLFVSRLPTPLLLTAGKRQQAHGRAPAHGVLQNRVHRGPLIHARKRNGRRGTELLVPRRQFVAILLERLQEGDQLVLLSIAQRAVVVDDKGGFAAMTQDRVIAGEGQQIMHQPALEAQSPQGRRAHLVGRALTAVLDNAI